MLLEGDMPLRLGSRALEILLVLTERPGRLVAKGALIRRVWPDTVVDEANLRVHVSGLRKALGEGHNGARYIANVPGRGYSFVAPVSHATEAPRVRQPPAHAVHNLPGMPRRPIGRRDCVESLLTRLPERRFMTILGPGGIGKTTVALAIAESLAANYRDGIRFVDLAALSASGHAPSAVAAALGLTTVSEDLTWSVVNFLAGRQTLLIFDSCERVIEDVAALAEEIVAGAPETHILATSREALRAAGEWCYRLPLLDVPPPGSELTAVEALSFSAVQLFVERAAASLDGFELTDTEAPAVAEICRRLDGMALAIEVAAGRVDAFGVAGLAARLEDRFQLVSGGRRTALRRHRTLEAMLDWSYDFLVESERVLLRRLAVFVGSFTLEAARAVAAGDDLADVDVVDGIADLVAKSLVTVDVSGETVCYRLLDTTRAYAQAKLADEGELACLQRRHAGYYRELLARAEFERDSRPAAEWLTEYGGQIDNVRAALSWAFSADGDEDLGVELTIVAAPLWYALSLLGECRTAVERALAATGSETASPTPRTLRLMAALGPSFHFDTTSAPEDDAILAAGVRIAERIGDIDHQLRGLMALWLSRLTFSDFPDALRIGRRFRALADSSSHSVDPLLGERMIGFALDFLGDPAAARRHLERMLTGYDASVHRVHINRYWFDHEVTARVRLGSILWLQGYPDQAAKVVDLAVQDAQALDHDLSLCLGLVGSIAVALYVGDLEKAERYLQLLCHHQSRSALERYRPFVRSFEGVLRIAQGDPEAGAAMLGSMRAPRAASVFAFRYTALLIELAKGLAAGGDRAEALSTIEAAFARCERNDERWCMAELFRLKGELTACDDAASAERLFGEGLDWARRQQALSWELRGATSLAKHWHGQGRSADARALLTPVFGRFTEGFGTADLQTAAALLRNLEADCAP